MGQILRIKSRQAETGFGQRHGKELSWVFRVDPQNSLLGQRSYKLLKRIFDVTFVLALSPLWLPLLAFLAVLIKLESPRDPVFYLRPRTGKGGRRFTMYKFRTMVSDPNATGLDESVHLRPGWRHDPVLAAKMLREHTRKHTGPQSAQVAGTVHDGQTTVVGRKIRRLYLDELPQMFNVLTGEMSLVGPRPSTHPVAAYDLWQTERVEVQPGVTGLWQIFQNQVTGFEDRYRLDVLYARRRCFRLDIEILLRTPVVVFSMLGKMLRPKRG